MKIFLGHNYYQIKGGEDSVAYSEKKLLEKNGNRVYLYSKHNNEIKKMSVSQKIGNLLTMGYSKKTYKEVRLILKKEKPDIAHFHNIYYLITPAIYFACKDEGIPIVHSLHNFRQICVNGLLFRNGMICEECLNTSIWRGVTYNCFKNSKLLTTILTYHIWKNWKRHVWTSMVDCYITATHFTSTKYLKMGIPKDKFRIKPNFYDNDPGDIHKEKKYGLYIGRLSPEKGVGILIDAWQSIKGFDLMIIGDGPLAGELQNKISSAGIRNIKLLGFVDAKEYDMRMREAAFVVVPSLCYENFPRIVAESFAYGNPVIASNFGSLKEIVLHRRNGMLFNPGDPHDLFSKISLLLSNADLLESLGLQARKDYLNNYSEQKNYEILMNIYSELVKT